MTSPTDRCVVVDDVAAVATCLRDRPGRVRLRGGGSRQDRLAAAGDATVLDLSRLASIVRLDGPDQTCTVECGVRREHLDQELAPHGLELPCVGGGTLGGLFASDPIGASTFGGPSPRSLLLGMDAVLADGTPFRSGARVVKSVAGFDVHKLLVGSEGRLFVATRLHLRLKPAPRTSQWFAMPGLDDARALALVQTLQQEPVAPTRLQVRRAGTGDCTVQGRVAGRAAFVLDLLRRHGLRECAPCGLDHLPAPTGGEVVAGITLSSALPDLWRLLPPQADLLWHAGGRYEVALPTPVATDDLLRALAARGDHAILVHGDSARRGRLTPHDPGHQRIHTGLKATLDPHGRLV